MATAMTFFVENDGIKLPDGTVWGGGITPVHQITDRAEGDYLDVFHIYFWTGKQWIPESNPLRYREMRELVHSWVRHYDSCGMKLWQTDHSEWDKAKTKTLVTLDW